MSGIKYCDQLPGEIRGRLAVVDGRANPTGQDFLQSIWEQLDFPASENRKWDAYLDWMRDLSWIREKQIAIVIDHFEEFLGAEPLNKEFFVSDLVDVIFPFWNNEAASVFNDAAAFKDITVYCVTEAGTNSLAAGTAQLAAAMSSNALAGQKTPHRMGHPVLRMYDGKLCLAAFISFHTRDQLRSALGARPAMWILADLQTGQIIQRFSCQERDFTRAAFDKQYDLSAEGIQPHSAAYWQSLGYLLDLIRAEYVRSGVLRRDLYQAYLDRIMLATPKDYQIFYRDLSCIEKEDVSMEMERNMEIEEQNAAPETPVPEGGASQKELLEKLDALQQAVAGLQEAFDDKIAEDTHKNGLFDSMHRELTRYQNGALEKIVDTMSLDIIQLVDSTKGHVRVYEKKDPTEENYKRLLRIVKGVAEDLEDILYRQNIESYRVDGHEVDVRRQKIIQTVATDDPKKDNLVAFRCADGYEKSGKVFRPERIKIFKYSPEAADTTKN